MTEIHHIELSADCDQVIVDGMEYQPCVASGNKKMARVEAAVACLQDLAAVPPGQAVPPVLPPPMVVPGGAPRPTPWPQSEPPRPRPPHPVQRLMSFQPRPRFASLHSHRPPSQPVPIELPPPAVEVADFTADIFDDIQQFESTAMKASVDQPPPGHLGVDSEQETAGEDTENSELELEESSGESAGDAPQRLEADDTDYDNTPAVFNEFSGGHRPRPPLLATPHIFRENPDNEYIDGEGYSEEMSDFIDDNMFAADGPGVFDACHDNDLCDDFYEPQPEVWEEDFTSDTGFETPARFGLRGLRPALRPVMRPPFRACGPRPPLIGCRPRMPPPQRFLQNPLQRFPRPFGVPSLRGPTHLPRGFFRPRMRPFVRPFPPRPH